MTTTAPTAPASDDARLRLLAGRARAIELMPYFSTGLMALVPVRSEGQGLDTFAVDKRWRMYWNPDFTRTLTVEECAGAWLHELGHVMREHGQRFEALAEPKRRHSFWNMAGDAAINVDLAECNITLPKIKAVLPTRIAGAQRNSTTEQMYWMLVNGPAGQAQQAARPKMMLAPSAVRYDYADAHAVQAFTADPIVTAATTVEILDATGSPVPGALKGHTVTSDRQVSLQLAAGALDPGQYQVALTESGTTLTADLTVIYPSIKMRPDHVERGYAAPYNTVIEGSHTRFDAATTVEITDSTGTAVTGAVANAEVISATYIRFDLPLLPDGLYTVTVTAGTEVCAAPLPVGLPHLEINPEELPVGYGTPMPVAALATDLTFDATTTVTVLDPAQAYQPVATAVTNITVISAESINFDLAESLPEGQYLVQAVTGTETAFATLTVANGQGGGEGGGQGEGEEDEDNPECGSGAGGGTRPWEKGDDVTDDGSVNEGRAETIRQNVAKAIKEASRTRGTVPGGWERWADEYLDPQVDWRKELNAVARRVTATVAGRRDYSYARPSRRQAVFPSVIMPSMRSPKPPIVDCIVDTSGSMSDDDLKQVLGEIAAITDRVSKRGSTLRVRSCDASSAKAQSIRDVKHVNLVGGGGTDMRIGIAAAAKERPKSDLIIVLTDGETPWPTEPDPNNPGAKYVAVLVRGEASYSQVPDWMHKIVINDV